VLKDIQEALNKCREKPCSGMQRLNVIERPSLHKLVYNPAIQEGFFFFFVPWIYQADFRIIMAKQSTKTR
jgi:hypothetical protein